MVNYEFKKIFGSLGSKIALVLIAVAVAIACGSSISGGDAMWYNENGQWEYGVSAARKVRAARKAWAGPLTVEKITAAIRENQRIDALPEGRATDADSDTSPTAEAGIRDIRIW